MGNITKANPDSSPALRLLVALPALNEQETVADVIRRVPKSIDGISAIEIVVVDDGSTDATVHEATLAGASIIQHGATRGVGAAFHTALNYCLETDSDLLVTIDSDGQFNPEDIPALIAPVIIGDADFSTASRFANPRLTPKMPWIKLWGNRMMSRLISRLAGQRFFDVSCGMRCYHRNAAAQLYLLAKFTYTQEVFLNLAFRGLRIVEVPIKVRGTREFGESRVANNVWAYGFKTATIIFRSYRDFHPLRFFGVAAALALGISLVVGVFFLLHYLRSGAFYPHTWAAATSVAALGIGLLLAQIGIIGDMLNRHRLYLEELLKHQRLARQIRDDERS